MTFIAAHADRRTADGLRWSVEPICRVLTEHGTPIAPSTFYDARERTSAHQQRDERLKGEIVRVHAATRALAERGNSLLKTTFKALRRVSLCPWRIGAITAAARVLLRHSTVGPHDQQPGEPLLGMARLPFQAAAKRSISVSDR